MLKKSAYTEAYITKERKINQLLKLTSAYSIKELNKMDFEEICDLIIDSKKYCEV